MSRHYYPEWSTRAAIAKVWGNLHGVKIVPRLPGEDIADDELRWEPHQGCYIAGPIAWRVFMQLRELKVESGPEGGTK